MRKMSEDMTIIYVTRPIGHTAAVNAIENYLKRIGTLMYCGRPKSIFVNGAAVAVCNTFCIDGYVDRIRLHMMLDKAGLSEHYYIEIWSDIADQDLSEHVCLGYNGQSWMLPGYECFKTSKHPEITPEYLTEDYAVAFLDDSAKDLVLDTCSFTCRKW